MDLSKLGSVRCSPLINPFLLSYSGKNGFSYRQEFKYNRIFTGDRLLRLVPRLGYNFKYNEFYWSVKSDFDYWPRKRAALHISVGNGHRIYSSRMLDELKIFRIVFSILIRCNWITLMTYTCRCAIVGKL